MCKSTFETQMENRVRDMYGVNHEKMTEAQRKTFRRQKLSTNPNVLFRIYKQDRLHILQFRSIHFHAWVECLKSYRLIKFHHNSICNEFSLCGPSDELQKFCNNFFSEILQWKHGNGFADTACERRHDLRPPTSDLRPPSVTCSSPSDTTTVQR